MKSRKTVFVGMSGGVDSSVAALRLKKQGYKVVGVFIKVWHPEFMVCNWEEERLDAMRVAAHLEIPFLTCDAENEYRDEVAQYFIAEYKAGRTPNPDVMCNKQIKFGAFIRFAKAQGADFIATGHYAQRIDTDIAELHRGIDQNKDQTYFLWTLTQEQLAYTLFPVGDTPKEQIRKEAERAQIPVAEKQDSQGICFLGHVDIPDFLSHYIELTPGKVLNPNGEVIGTHKGAFVYTIGQRHGFTLTNNSSNSVAHYVTGKDIVENTLTASTEKPQLAQKETVTLTETQLRTQVGTGDLLTAQFRYRQQPFTVTVEKIANSEIEIAMQGAIEEPAVGQSCVLYRDTHCIGGGMIA